MLSQARHVASRRSRPARRRFAAPLLAALAAAVSATALTPALAAPAVGHAHHPPTARSAAAATGTVTLALGGGSRAARALARATRVSAIAPAVRRGQRLRLPVASLAVGRTAALRLRGGLRLRSGRRAVALRALRVRLTARRATVSARAGKRRVGFAVARLRRGAAELDRSNATARLAGARLALTPAATRLLRSRLGVSGLRSGRVGRIGIDARLPRAGGGGQGGGPSGGGGAPGGGTPQSGPIEDEPPVAVRPATAVEVSGVSIAWYPRDSWIRYLSSGTGAEDGILASGGATKATPTTTPDHPCSDVAYAGSGSFDYAFHYAPKPGASWYDPVTQSAAVYGLGSVRFRWLGHGIDLAASDPEIELGPAAPRAIFRFGGSGGTAYPDQRAVLETLDLAGQPTVAGGTRTYTAVRGRLTEDGAAVFAGFYPVGDGFGCLTVSFTTP